MQTAAPAAIDLDALASDTAEALLDLGSFGHFVGIRTKDETAGIVDFGWERWWPEQRRFHRERTGRDIIVKARQVGFSTGELLRDYQYARTHEGVNVVVVVHIERVKRKLFSALRLMDKVHREWGLAPEARDDTIDLLSWPDNESSIEIIEAGSNMASASDRGRSGTIHRLHCTEVAYYKAAAETMTALLASLSPRGECVIESTANGTTGPGAWFHEKTFAARDGLFENYALHFFPWFEHEEYRADPAAMARPPRTEREEQIERELRELGCDDAQIAWWRGQVSKTDLDRTLREYPPTLQRAFQQSLDTWIEQEHLDRLRRRVDQRPTLRPLERNGRRYGSLRIYREPERDRGYLVIVDPSGGTGNDEAAIKVLEHRSGEDVASWHSTTTKPGDLGHIAADVARFYNHALLVVERNDFHGENGEGRETLLVLQRDERYQRIYYADDGKPGWHTNGKTRPIVLEDLHKMISDGIAWSPDARTVAEAAAMVKDDDGRIRAKGKGKPGGSDDGLFMCWGIGHQVRQSAPMPGTMRAAAVGPPLSSTRFKT